MAEKSKIVVPHTQKRLDDVPYKAIATKFLVELITLASQTIGENIVYTYVSPGTYTDANGKTTPAVILSISHLDAQSDEDNPDDDLVRVWFDARYERHLRKVMAMMTQELKLLESQKAEKKEAN